MKPTGLLLTLNSNEDSLKILVTGDEKCNLYVNYVREHQRIGSGEQSGRKLQAEHHKLKFHYAIGVPFEG